MSPRAKMIGFACCVAVGLLSVFVRESPFDMRRGIFDGLALSVLFTIGFVVGAREERRRLYLWLYGGERSDQR